MKTSKCLVKNIKRGIVIYQYNPLLIPQGEKLYEKYITAWTSQRKLNGDRISILTICLIPSKKNMETSKLLIKAWFEKKKNIRQLIANIYELQENPINNIELYEAQQKMREYCISNYGEEFYERSADAIAFIVENEYCHTERSNNPCTDIKQYEEDMRLGALY